MAGKHAQLRAALPVPPYTTKSSGFSATSGSRLFINMRRAASCCHPLQESVVPRAARKGPLDIELSATVPEIVALMKDSAFHLNARPLSAPHRPDALATSTTAVCLPNYIAKCTLSN